MSKKELRSSGKRRRRGFANELARAERTVRALVLFANKLARAERNVNEKCIFPAPTLSCLL